MSEEDVDVRLSSSRFQSMMDRIERLARDAGRSQGYRIRVTEEEHSDSSVEEKLDQLEERLADLEEEAATVDYSEKFHDILESIQEDVESLEEDNDEAVELLRDQIETLGERYEELAEKHNNFVGTATDSIQEQNQRITDLEESLDTPERVEEAEESGEETASECSQDFEDVPVSEGDVVELEIEDTGGHGDGIAREEGYVIFVPDAEVGETYEVEILSVGRKFAFGEIFDEENPEHEVEEETETDEQKETETDEQEETVEDQEKDDDGFECPQCGEEDLDSIRSVAVHTGRSNDHVNILEFFENEAGAFECVFCGQYENRNEHSFKQHVSERHGVTSTELYLENYDELAETTRVDSEGFNANGNIPELHQVKHIEDYGKEKIGEIVADFLDDKDHACRLDKIAEEVFDQEAESGTTRRTKLNQALNSAERIKSRNDSYDARRNAYYTGESKQVIEPE